MFDCHRVFGKLTHSFIRGERGAVMVIFALTAIPMVAFAGLSIDAGRAYYAHTVVASAVDAAAIAAGRATQSTSTAAANMLFNANIPPSWASNGWVPTTPVITDTGTSVTVSSSVAVPATLMKLIGQKSLTVRATSQVQREFSGLEVSLVMDNTGSMTQSAGTGNSKLVDMKNAAKMLVSLLACNATTCSGSPSFPKGTYVALVPYTTTVNIGTYAQEPGRWNNWLIQSALASSPTAVIGTGTGQGMTAYPSGSNNPVIQTWTTATAPTFAFLQPYSNTSYFTHGNLWTATEAVTSKTTGSGKNKVTTNTATTTFANRGAWTGCVQARLDNAMFNNGDGEGDDTYPTSSNTTRWGVYDNIVNSGCPQKMKALQQDYNTVINAINAMTAQGATAVNIGLAWGYRTLSPAWSGQWSDATTGAVDVHGNAVTLPQVYGTTNKAVVLLTDGYNQISGYSGYGTLSPSNPTTSYPGTSSAPRAPFPMIPSAFGTLGGASSDQYQGVLNTRMLALCTRMKAQGITIYTILLGPQSGTAGAAAQSVMQNCATQPSSSYYFPAPSSAQLQGIFQTIATSLQNLRYRYPGTP